MYEIFIKFYNNIPKVMFIMNSIYFYHTQNFNSINIYISFHHILE